MNRLMLSSGSSGNVAAEMPMPRNIKPKDAVPYTLAEESVILAACDSFGGGPKPLVLVAYERLWARAMVLTLRHTALRVSDVCTPSQRCDLVGWGEGHLARDAADPENG
jgi:hypothetical protein